MIAPLAFVTAGGGTRMGYSFYRRPVRALAAGGGFPEARNGGCGGSSRLTGFVPSSTPKQAK